MDLFDALDQKARDFLAMTALDSIMAPDEKWLETHQLLSLDEDFPSERQIENDLDGMRAVAYMDGGEVDTEIDPSDTRSMARYLGAMFRQAQDSIESARQANAQEFLEALKQSVQWSVKNKAVDHPVVRVEQWMSMARNMGLAHEARGVLMGVGGPRALGRWWEQSVPLSESWTQAFRAFRRMAVSQSAPHADEWLGPLLDTPICSLSGRHNTNSKRPQQDVYAFRQEMMANVWAELVSRRYSESPLDDSGQRIIERLDQEGFADMELLDWGVIFEDQSEIGALAEPKTIQKRLGALLSKYYVEFRAWREGPDESPDAVVPEARRFINKTPDSENRLSLEQTGQVLTACGYSTMEVVMSRLDEAAEQRGLEKGYASALAGAAISAGLDATTETPKPARPKTRM